MRNPDSNEPSITGADQDFMFGEYKKAPGRIYIQQLVDQAELINNGHKFTDQLNRLIQTCDHHNLVAWADTSNPQLWKLLDSIPLRYITYIVIAPHRHTVGSGFHHLDSLEVQIYLPQGVLRIEAGWNTSTPQREMEIVSGILAPIFRNELNDLLYLQDGPGGLETERQNLEALIKRVIRIAGGPAQHPTGRDSVTDYLLVLEEAIAQRKGPDS